MTAARRAGRVALWAVPAAFVLVAAAALWLVLDAGRSPVGDPIYVALGSSYAAGAGLGARQTGSPVLCGRTVNGYPPRVARSLGLPLVDMSCGGAVTRHVSRGGQFFQDAQIRALSPRTRQVTVTVGGNDVGFVRDLGLLAARKGDGVLAWATRRLWDGPPAVAARDFAGLDRELTFLLRAVRARSPAALVVVATYPPVLPERGTCAALRLTADEAELMRGVEARLTAVTRAAAERQGAAVVDMRAAGAGHDACSAEPWTHRWVAGDGQPFHPTMRGAEAVAERVAAVRLARRAASR